MPSTLCARILRRLFVDVPEPVPNLRLQASLGTISSPVWPSRHSLPVRCSACGCSRVCGAQGRGLHVTAAGCLQHHGADARGGGGAAADRALGQGAQRLRLGWRKALSCTLAVLCSALCKFRAKYITATRRAPMSFLGQRRGRRTDLGVRPRHIQLLPGGIPSASDQEPHCTPPN